MAACVPPISQNCVTISHSGIKISVPMTTLMRSGNISNMIVDLSLPDLSGSYNIPEVYDSFGKPLTFDENELEIFFKIFGMSNKEDVFGFLNEKLKKNLVVNCMGMDEFKVSFKDLEIVDNTAIFTIFDDEEKVKINLEIIKKYIILANYLENDFIVNALLEYFAFYNNVLYYPSDTDKDITLDFYIAEKVNWKIIQNLSIHEQHKALMNNIKDYYKYYPTWHLPSSLARIYCYGSKTNDEVFAPPYWYCKLKFHSNIKKLLVKDGICIYDIDQCLRVKKEYSQITFIGKNEYFWNLDIFGLSTEELHLFSDRD